MLFLIFWGKYFNHESIKLLNIIPVLMAIHWGRIIIIQCVCLLISAADADV